MDLHLFNITSLIAWALPISAILLDFKDRPPVNRASPQFPSRSHVRKVLRIRQHRTLQVSTFAQPGFTDASGCLLCVWSCGLPCTELAWYDQALVNYMSPCRDTHFGRRADCCRAFMLRCTIWNPGPVVGDRWGESRGEGEMPRLGLALSGGGLRATLFHLGVVRFLRDAGLLGEVTHIVSVSGGSILGAHLALNWARYNGSAAEFEAAASKIIDFVQSDARNQIARRMPFLVPIRLLRRFAIRGPSRTVTPTGLLEKLYAKHLYGDARVHQLPESPELHLLTTNMSEGGLCSFTRAGLIMQHRTSGGIKVEILPARLTPIALAVTASSAFPGFFPPALITADDIGLSEGEFPAQTFTDGGVYDNLGVRVFDLLEHLDPALDQIVVSDVGKPFSIVRSHSLGMIGRSMRASDILWDRVGQLEQQKFQHDPRFLFVAALDQVDLKDDPTALHPVIQSEVANIRTDLDRFSPVDIAALVQHGYCVAASSAGRAPTSTGRTYRPLRRGTR